MAGQSRKWLILVATIWIQAFTGTNFDLSAYSSDMKSVLRISQLQLNYLATASDLGKLFGWSSGLALLYLPLWVVLFMAAFMGLIAYGLQWLVIARIITIPYFLVFLLCLLAGCSICWFNTVCFILCIRNFPSNRPLALSLTISFNGISAALYTLAGTAINSSSSALYLILNAIFPLITSIAALLPILFQPSSINPLPPDRNRSDSLKFLLLNFIAVLTGIYLVLFGQATFDSMASRLLFGGAILLLILPLCVPGVVYAKTWFQSAVHSSFHLEGSGFVLVDDDDLQLHKEILSREANANDNFDTTGQANLLVSGNGDSTPVDKADGECKRCCQRFLDIDKLAVLGEEHSAKLLVRRLDFWLYFVAYFCGGTIGLVYSNNLGQIAQSLGQSTSTTTVITLYSSFSFFGRLLSAAPDYLRAKFYFARTGWLTIALLPTPVAFFLLASAGSKVALHVGTALIGLSSGFIFAAAVSITSELFGPNSVGVNHNILITNIPMGSLLYGLLAAIIYDTNASSSSAHHMTEMVVCMGRKCYFLTFVLWGCLSVVGLASSLVLSVRTRLAYNHFERNRISASSQQLNF